MLSFGARDQDGIDHLTRKLLDARVWTLLAIGPPFIETMSIAYKGALPLRSRA
jgi:hypothetical protein